LVEAAMKEGKTIITVAGESISLDNIVNYFARNEQADVVEAYVDRRTAAEALNKAGGNAANIVKWIIVFGILIVCIAVALVIIMEGLGGAKGSGGVTMDQLTALANQLAQQQPRVVTNVTGSAIQ
jgi:hypothetical protein